MLIHLHEIVDDRLCYEKVRELRWAEGVKCPIALHQFIGGMATITALRTAIGIIAKRVTAIMTT